MSADARDAAPPFGPLFSAFAAGYLLSYLFRTANAVISPELSRELALEPAALGFLTSGYLLAFGVMQIPAGMLLDRFGPRRVEPVLLVLAGCGSLMFALSDGLAGLTLGRAIIGAGVSVCLMAPLKGIAMWYPPARHPSLSSWIMVAGGIGVLLATAPLEFALRFTSWRSLFIAFAAATFAVALCQWFVVPDIPRAKTATGIGEQWRGVRQVFRHPRFWWIAPLAGAGMGTFMSIQGLWAVPWLMEVEGLSRAAAASALFIMGIFMVSGYLFYSLFATALGRRGLHPRHFFAIGFTTSAVALACITARVPGSVIWWTLYGVGVTSNIMSFALLNEGFPRELAARANTAVNLFMFLGSFVAQLGIGLVVDAARAIAGVDTAAGLKIAFAMVATLDFLAAAWFYRGWKRFAIHDVTLTAQRI